MNHQPNTSAKRPNFFELAVAITQFGPGSGAALATVVGVLVEVPVMLSVCRISNQSRGGYQEAVPPDSEKRLAAGAGSKL